MSTHERQGRRGREAGSRRILQTPPELTASWPETPNTPHGPRCAPTESSGATVTGTRLWGQPGAFSFRRSKASNLRFFISESKAAPLQGDFCN